MLYQAARRACEWMHVGRLRMMFSFAVHALERECAPNNIEEVCANWMNFTNINCLASSARLSNAGASVCARGCDVAHCPRAVTRGLPGDTVPIRMRVRASGLMCAHCTCARLRACVGERVRLRAKNACMSFCHTSREAGNIGANHRALIAAHSARRETYFQ